MEIATSVLLVIAFIVVLAFSVMRDRDRREIERIYEAGNREYNDLVAIMAAFDFQEPSDDRARFVVCGRSVVDGHADDCRWRAAYLRQWTHPAFTGTREEAR